MDWFVIFGWVFVALTAFSSFMSMILASPEFRNEDDLLPGLPSTAALMAVMFALLAVWLIVALGRLS